MSALGAGLFQPCLGLLRSRFSLLEIGGCGEIAELHNDVAALDVIVHVEGHFLDPCRHL
jgi:hypothetical protein